MKITVCVFAVLFLYGCGTDSSGDALPVVDVTAGYSERELVLQEIAEVQTVPLETGADFLVAGHPVYADAERFIFSNYDSGDILFFRADGKGLHKINRKGRGGEEYLGAGSVLFDPVSGELFVYDRQRSKMLVYDEKGTFLRKFAFPDHFGNFRLLDEAHLVGLEMEFTADGRVLDSLPPYAVFSRADGQMRERLALHWEGERFSTVLVKDGMVSVAKDYPVGYSVVGGRRGLLLSAISCDTLFRVGPSLEIDPVLVRRPEVHSMDSRVFLQAGKETDRYVFMQTLNELREIRVGSKPRSLVCDKKDGSVFVPVLKDAEQAGAGKRLELSAMGADLRDGIDLILVEQPFDLLERAQDGMLSGELVEVARTLGEEDNPVLRIVRFKK